MARLTAAKEEPSMMELDDGEVLARTPSRTREGMPDRIAHCSLLAVLHDLAAW
jgi:hypothetical protein